MNANHVTAASGSVSTSPQSVSPSVNGQYVDREPLFSVNPMNGFNMNTAGSSDDDSDSDEFIDSNRSKGFTANTSTLRLHSGDTLHSVVTLADLASANGMKHQSLQLDQPANYSLTPSSAVYHSSAAALQQFGSAVSVDVDVDEIGSSAAMESYTINTKEDCMDGADVEDSDDIDGGEQHMTFVSLPEMNELPTEDVSLEQNLSSHFSEGPKSTIGAMDQFMMFSSDIRQISVMNEDDQYS